MAGLSGILRTAGERNADGAAGKWLCGMLAWVQQPLARRLEEDRRCAGLVSGQGQKEQGGGRRRWEEEQGYKRRFG